MQPVECAKEIQDSGFSRGGQETDHPPAPNMQNKMLLLFRHPTPQYNFTVDNVEQIYPVYSLSTLAKIFLNKVKRD